MWDLIVSVPYHCLSFYFTSTELYQIRQTEILATVKDNIWINSLFQLNACVTIVFYQNVAHNCAKSSKLMLMKQL